MIISMGYRVRSPQGTQFRIWATQRLKEYIVKGFTMDDERLKEPQNERYLKNFWLVSVTFVLLKRCSGVKFWISMPPTLYLQGFKAVF